MNKTALLKAEKQFLRHYPGGFEHPDLLDVRKKFKTTQHGEFAQEHFAPDKFDRPAQVLKAMSTLASRSALVSMFEKPRLKEGIANLTPGEKRKWADSLFELVHGDQETGFEGLVVGMAKHKLAKWTLVSLVPAYYSLQREIFVKPTTTKLIVNKMELDLTYKATPSWAFYRDYRKALLQMRRIAKGVKAPNNPAFSGFLMMTLEKRL